MRPLRLYFALFVVKKYRLNRKVRKDLHKGRKKKTHNILIFRYFYFELTLDKIETYLRQPMPTSTM
ncbi:hypothetical protein D0T57_07235 [Dysgonomonas sp. 511]|nr:hypothetical protein [Dysgonomonas sp. 511]